MLNSSERESLNVNLCNVYNYNVQVIQNSFNLLEIDVQEELVRQISLLSTREVSTKICEGFDDIRSSQTRVFRAGMSTNVTEHRKDTYAFCRYEGHCELWSIST